MLYLVHLEIERAKTDPSARLKSVAPETKDIIAELKGKEFTSFNTPTEKKHADVVNAVRNLMKKLACVYGP